MSAILRVRTCTNVLPFLVFSPARIGGCVCARKTKKDALGRRECIFTDPYSALAVGCLHLSGGRRSSFSTARGCFFQINTSFRSGASLVRASSSMPGKTHINTEEKENTIYIHVKAG